MITALCNQHCTFDDFINDTMFNGNQTSQILNFKIRHLMLNQKLESLHYTYRYIYKEKNVKS